MSLSLVWFKRDLRLFDHAALSAASERGAVLPLYIWEDEQLGHPEFTASHLSLTNDALGELSAGLARLGAPLHLARGEAAAVIERLHGQHGFTAIYAHQETGNGVSYQRDRRVRAWAKSAGLPFFEPPQNGVVRRLKSRDGWADEWEARMAAPLLPLPARLCGPPAPPFARLSAQEAGLPPSSQSLPWRAGEFGEELAHATLASFLTRRGLDYPRTISSPLSAEEGCSRLSVHLAHGTLSLRTAVQATRRRLAAVLGDPQADPRWVRALRSFESRLHWHCHFMQRLESEPPMEFRALNSVLEHLRPNELDDASRPRFEAWAQGRSGFPMIDACMRMLLQTGWLNFRMRAMLVSFACQHLWLPWRAVGLYLARLWLDNEPGIHWAQMQMQSSVVGINAVRIYSPTRQAQAHDPDGTFIRRWLPELARLPLPYLHQPWTLPPLLAQQLDFVAGRDYPVPVAEEGLAAREAMSRIYALKQTPAARAEAARVYQRHGSRKKALLRQEGKLKPKATPPTPPRRRLPTMSEKQPGLFDAPDAQDLAVPELPTLPPDWQAALGSVLTTPAFRELLAFVEEQRVQGPVYPAPEDVFNALRLTPLSEVKVLILGQDPYHGAGQAHGLSFSVRPGVRPPPSLQNIYKELSSDVGFKAPRHGDLRSWARQGVLLLNAVLTVRQGEPNSHAGRGWEAFTDAVIRAVSAQKQSVVFILWGAYARKKTKLIAAPPHVVLESAHPSPLSVTKFLGTRPFSQANAALEAAGRAPVQWQLPMTADA
ncbi:uracil-DNA glycosylase [Deinococcus sp.]|uniref:uracil-DNA glycosylase n=1 Tax=Deinococcus sp. TaxID=47478 RepID=UPI003CC5988D